MELHVAIESGQLDRARSALAQIEAFADEVGRPTLSWFATYFGAGWALLHGDLDGTERLAKEALGIGREAGQPDAVLVYAAVSIIAKQYQGRGEEVVERLEQSVAMFPRLAVWRAFLASLYCWLGRRADAEAVMEEAARDGFAHINWDSARTAALILYADAAAELGLADTAAILYEQLEPWADRVVWTGASGLGYGHSSLGRLAAALGRHEQADEHFALACEFQDANGIALWGALTHLDWGRTLVARGEHLRAGEQAARAVELAREHGYPQIEERAAAILEAAAPVGN